MKKIEHNPITSCRKACRNKALEKACLIACTASDGLGMIHILLEMPRLKKEIGFMDENQAVDRYTSFLKRKGGKSRTKIF